MIKTHLICPFVFCEIYGYCMTLEEETASPDKRTFLLTSGSGCSPSVKITKELRNFFALFKANKNPLLYP